MTGKVLSGIGMLVTGGGLGIWWLLDLRSVATCAFRDKQGLLVAMPPQKDMSNKSFGTIFSYCFVLYTVSLPEKRPCLSITLYTRWLWNLGNYRFL